MTQCWRRSYEDSLIEAEAWIDLCNLAGFDHVCWKADASYDTWILGMNIIGLSRYSNHHIYGAYDMGQPKDHGNQKRYQGYPPIPGRTLFL